MKRSIFVVLLSPAASCFCAVVCFDVARGLLLLSADVESNADPDTQTMLAKILERQNAVAEAMTQLKGGQRGSDKAFSKINDRFMAMEGQLASLITCAKKIDEYQEKVSSLTAMVDALNTKIDDLQNRSRRNNLIVYGVQKSGDDVPERLEEVVDRGIVSKTVGVPAKNLERIHRLGKKNWGKATTSYR